ncbi:FKBP-type peptidyl-prolyl cis-trans isomerase [Dactylosporangium sp. NBC_01737]|uniref:FKBP-type peptidyl-prolyl cis-trans isomerase n=1 Tax=Dactylosporangium sp. NBC_01737 TaxID=2975959 RepID=UPI002E11E79C|nr:FKBP-type peptidyl-prolyl cis-trans isomerase [Dactylosporangium sp. NBC_01737]
MTDRVANKQRGPAPKRAGASTQLDKSKAEKRAAAKAAKARAVAAEKRRRVLSIVGAAAAVLVLIVGITLYARSGDDDPSTPAAGTSGAASDAASQPAAFPPLPADADPALKTKPTATAGTGTVSKLVVTTLVEGKGAATQKGQNLTVNYVGVTYADGKEFDSSWKSSQPLDFQVGMGGVIQGWDEGLVGVKVGSRVQLDIPAAMAYGDNPEGGRPAGALRFIVDVLAAA